MGLSYNCYMETHNTPALNSRNISEYISGFVDGEGCFSVSFSKRPRFLVGWETKPSFSVSQNYNRAEPLFIMQKYFGCGFMRDGKSDQTIKYEVRRLSDLLEKIIPHFEKYPLISGKQKDVELLKKVCLLMKQNKHVNSMGIKNIIEIAFKMNGSGKRKYTKKDILDFVRDQMKV